MNYALSDKSKMSRMDAACGLAILLRECCHTCSILTFSEHLVQVPPRNGMALRDSIVQSQPHSGTYLGGALNSILNNLNKLDRIIVITDEQVADNMPRVPTKKNYILNIAGYQNGIGSKDQWFTITGFSEASIDFIREYENELDLSEKSRT
jgi:hypothetical protein